VSAVNSALLAERRKQASERIDAHYGTLTKDMAAVKGDPTLRTACLKPLETLKQRVEVEESIAHITQAEVEAVKEFDNGIGRIEEFARKLAEKPGKEVGLATKPAVVKTQRVLRPAELVKTTYLETQDDVDGFLDKLRQELEKALAKNERIQIR
jgi:cell division septum initiation protein DivIVA